MGRAAFPCSLERAATRVAFPLNNQSAPLSCHRTRTIFTKKVTVKGMVNKRTVNRSLKRAVRRLTKIVGTKRSADALEISDARVHRFGNPNFPDELSCHDAMILEGLAGDLIISGFMAHSHGAALLYLPPHKAHQHLNVGFAGIAKELSALFASYLAARDGEKLDPKSARDLVVLCDDLMSSVSVVRTALSRVG